MTARVAPAKFLSMRSFRKVSLRKAAEGLGVSHAYLAEVETGKRPPSTRLLERASKFYNVSVTRLVEDCPTKPHWWRVARLRTGSRGVKRGVMRGVDNQSSP